MTGVQTCALPIFAAVAHCVITLDFPDDGVALVAHCAVTFDFPDLGIVSIEDGPRSDDRRGGSSDLLPEEREFLSETKARRIREGTLRISRSDYFVDGMMKRLITVKGEDEGEQ